MKKVKMSIKKKPFVDLAMNGTMPKDIANPLSTVYTVIKCFQ